MNVAASPVRNEASEIDVGSFLIEEVALNWMLELSHVLEMPLTQGKAKQERNRNASCLKVDSNGPKNEEIEQK